MRERRIDYALRFTHYVGFPLNFGNGKHMMKNGTHRKMMSNRFTMIINRINAQMVMMGIDNEQIMPSESPASSAHGPPSGTSRSLCSGHGKTVRIRSPRPRPCARVIWPHSTSLIMKAVFLSNLRRPAGVVSMGSAMRIGRAGASGSKKPAIKNGSVGSLTTVGCSGPQLGRSNTQRITKYVGAPMFITG